MEWLLAVATHNPEADVTAGISRGSISVRYAGRRKVDLVILIANLIGGITDE